MYRYLIKFAGTYIKSYMGVDHPITMVLLIFIFLLGITATTKGAYLQHAENNKFHELLKNRFLQSVAECDYGISIWLDKIS